MADVDTGLGWYADEDWLKSVTGPIGTIERSGWAPPDSRFAYLSSATTWTIIFEADAGQLYMRFTTEGNCAYFRAFRSKTNYAQIILMGDYAFHVQFKYEPNSGSVVNWEYDANQDWYGTGKYGIAFYSTYQGIQPSTLAFFDADQYTTEEVASMLYDAVYVKDKAYLYNDAPVQFMLNPYSGNFTSFEVTEHTAPVYYAVQVFYDSSQEVPYRWRHCVTLVSAESFSARIVGGSNFTIEHPSYGHNMYAGGMYWATQYRDNYVFSGLLPYTEFGFRVPYDGLYRVLSGGVAETISFAKSTAGYSVVCMCKWIASYGGDVYLSPVLISSQPNNTLYTRNSTAPSVNNTEHSYQGMTFYMRKAPLDVVDGTETITSDYPVVDLSGVAQTNDTIFAAIAYQSGLTVGYIPSEEDPYAPGGTSGPSEGTPDFTEVSESISPGSTFPISFQSTGLCRVYVPSITDLNDLANYLWTDQTFLDTIKNILINQFENFMEAVISLTMVPCQVPKDTAQPVKVMFLSTGLSFPPATQQFVEVDCGYVDIAERYASALDYNPYTKVSLYLPFIGTVPLDTDEVMGHRVKCVYTIDIVSGACVAKIMVDYPDSSNGVLYQFSGHCSISMPLTAADFSSYYAAAMSGLKMAAGLAAAGAGAPGLAGSLLGEPTAHPSSTTTTTRTTERNAATGRQILTGTESRETSHTPGQASFKELATRASVNTVGAVINSKFSVEHSGGFTGNTGFLGVQAPYVIITRPDMCNPDEYGAYNGRPSMMYLYLGNLSGFTQVQNIKLTGIPATNPELGEIAELLKTGVIL